jgi:UDP-N-acetylmuramoyl-L-alanyl-D-glutamate--2,6-diaminopimelate ligase
MGLVQNRLWGLEFEASTITNIQYDHLDYHETWENYARAKFLLVRKTKRDGLVVLNRDDEKSASWLEGQLNRSSKKPNIVWTSKSELDNLERSFTGVKFELDGVSFDLPMLGDFNIENALEAIRICQKYLSLEQISKALEKFPVPVGRMEVLQQEPFVVIIDFAHTPDALHASLRTLNALKQPDSRIISVFGCAGQRDVARRQMGAVAAELGDITILTAEDPRDEKLVNVNLEIFDHAFKKGGERISFFSDHKAWQAASPEALREAADREFKAGKKPFLLFDEDSVQSRTDAIDCALKLARPGDIVYITGKAHEASLCFGDTEYPWSDHKAVEGFLMRKAT